MKNNRQNAILKIISEHDIDTQEELIARLSDCGYAVTQATVSRDIRELKIVKTSSAGGSYKYVAPSKNEDAGHHVYSAAFAASVKSVDVAMNIVVIKTYPGLANAFAASLDSLGEIDIVGCVAGDDTIFAATRSVESAIEAANAIKNRIKV